MLNSGVGAMIDIGGNDTLRNQLQYVCEAKSLAAKPNVGDAQCQPS